MAERHIGVSLSMCVCMYEYVVIFAFSESCPTHSFVLQGGISKLLCTNDYHDKMICGLENPVTGLKVKVTLHR